MTITLLLFMLTAASPELRIDAAGDQAIVGSLAGVREEVHFEARTLGPARAAVRVRAGDFRLDADIDVRAQVARLNAVRGEVTPETREALGALALAVEGYLEPWERTLPLHESVLHRLTAFLSEAPAGLIFTTHVVTSSPPASTGSLQLFTCQQLDNDGIDYLSGGCALQGYPDICFDTQSECFACSTWTNGCDVAWECPGRCGGGCGFLSGFGTYSRDCAEHNACCDQNGQCNNPFNLNCGDEYWDASDDLLFGWILANCRGC